VSGVLASAEPAWTSGRQHVYVTRAHQLVGTREALEQYVAESCALYGEHAEHAGWCPHPVLSLGEAGAAVDQGARVRSARAPALYVLIPEVSRQRLAQAAAMAPQVELPGGLLDGYRRVHLALGDYTGAGIARIDQELGQLVRASLRCIGLHA